MPKHQVSKYIYSKSGKLYEIVENDSVHKAKPIKTSHHTKDKLSKKQTWHEEEDDMDEQVNSESDMEEDEQVEENLHTRAKSAAKSQVVKGKKASSVGKKVGADEQQLTGQAMLKKASSELLTESQLKEKTRKELEKNYRKSKAYCKWYEKILASEKQSKWPLWKQADDVLTKAAADLYKYKGLEKKHFDKDQPLSRAIAKLKQGGEAKFQKAHAMIAMLSEEDKAKFWQVQERNKNATCFEELVCKKSWDQMKLQKQYALSATSSSSPSNEASAKGSAQVDQEMREANDTVPSEH